MHMDVGIKSLVNFPDIQFRKKRLTVAIHAHFDMERAEDVTAVKQRVADSVSRLAEEGRAKVTLRLSDVKSTCSRDGTAGSLLGLEGAILPSCHGHFSVPQRVGSRARAAHPSVVNRIGWKTPQLGFWRLFTAPRAASGLTDLA